MSDSIPSGDRFLPKVPLFKRERLNITPKVSTLVLFRPKVINTLRLLAERCHKFQSAWLIFVCNFLYIHIALIFLY